MAKAAPIKKSPVKKAPVKNKGGRPVKYKTEYVKQVEKLCILGATNEEIADFFEVHVDTIHDWRKRYPTFSDAIKRGKLIADAEVGDKLFKRATGYEHPDLDIRVIKNKIVKTRLIKHYPPDTAAAIFWLKNRRPKEWREKQEIDHTTKGEKITPPTVTKEELQQLIDELNAMD